MYYRFSLRPLSPTYDNVAGGWSRTLYLYAKKHLQLAVNFNVPACELEKGVAETARYVSNRENLY